MLYIAKFKLEETPYMETEATITKHIRIVDAPSEEYAELLVKREYKDNSLKEFPYDYGVYRNVLDLELLPTIQA